MGVQSPPPRVDFTRDIEPVLKAHCVQCHGAAKAEAGLRLDARSFAVKGGVGGPAWRVGDSKKSLLLSRVLGEGGKPRMPLGFAPLTEQQIGLLRTWIDQGAVWPEAGAKSKHWAYIAPRRSPLPPVKKSSWVRNPIDRFVLARLEREGLSPSPEADRTTLIRRVTLDLTGLPPTPGEVEAFLRDRSPSAYEKVVDRLLASPHYGERMALPWLDAARYADSNGFQQDGDTYQYVWRDWVVRAYNTNMPFDQFTIEQLAGDLLPGATLDQKIATGFNRCHLLNGEGGAIPEEQRNVILFDRVDVTATTWLGATLACAQCHNHKYDPYTQQDYYRFMAFFNNVPETGTPPGGGQYRIADPWVYVPSEQENGKIAELEKKVQSSKAMGESSEAKARIAAAEKELESFRSTVPRVMVMSDNRPRKTHVLLRGNYESPAEEVEADTPEFLGKLPAAAPKNRLSLARWLVSDDNPLTSRVQVNRLWQIFFGAGLVKTSENLGTQCDPPLQRELLDWLAVEFRDGERGKAQGAGEVAKPWDVKHMVRLIVTSATYRQSSKVTPELLRRDPENRLFARGARFRLPSLLLRDVALASSGLLNDQIGGKPVYPYQPPGIWDGLSITMERDFTYPQSKGADLYRRSLYTFWRRTVGPADMFDASARQTCKVRVSITSTPLHALTMLNDVAWVEAGRALAERVMKEAGPDRDARLSDAYLRVCARRPGADELRILERSLNRSLAAFKADPKSADAFLKVGESPRDKALDPIEHAAYASVCLAIYNLDEAMTRE